jgi:5'-methylthioadenosine phosphorylase
MLVIEGPAFSTRAEARMHRQLGVDLVGMTAMPEAKLAREAELCYTTLALATDYDCWHDTAEDVTVKAVIQVLRQNVKNAQGVIRNLVSELGAERSCPCPQALDHAIITKQSMIPDEVRERLAPLLGRVL